MNDGELRQHSSHYFSRIKRVTIHLPNIFQPLNGMSFLLLSTVLTSISLAPLAAGQLWNWIPALLNPEWFSFEVAQQAHYHPESAFVCFNAELPNITVYSTGGTITAAADSRFETTNYDSAILRISTVIEANPTICETANIRVVELAREDSINIKLEAFKLWSQIIQDDLNDPFTQGAYLPREQTGWQSLHTSSR